VTAPGDANGLSGYAEETCLGAHAKLALGTLRHVKADAVPDHPELPYVRCPSCSFTAQPGSMDYRIAADGGIDWSATVYASCGICGREHVITEADALSWDAGHLDAEHICLRPGCGALTACPASAARVRCRQCGLYGFGPGTALCAARAELVVQEQLHDFELRQAALRARRTGGR
jgi:hypothetical protein